MTAAPIIVSALLAPAEQSWLDGLRQAHFPPERNRLSAHLTLFHHLPPSAATALAALLQEFATGPRPDATIAAIMNLGRGTAFRIDSPALVAMRGIIADNFAGSLIPQDQANWRPHVTVQNKVSPEQGRVLQSELGEHFAPRRTTIQALASWYYRGGPWELIARYSFRG